MYAIKYVFYDVSCQVLYHVLDDQLAYFVLTERDEDEAGIRSDKLVSLFEFVMDAVRLTHQKVQHLSVAVATMLAQAQQIPLCVEIVECIGVMLRRVPDNVQSGYRRKLTKVGSL